MLRRGYASAVLAAVAASLAYTSAFNLQGEYQKKHDETILEVSISECFRHSFQRRRQIYSSLFGLEHNVIGFDMVLKYPAASTMIKHNDISSFRAVIETF